MFQSSQSHDPEPSFATRSTEYSISGSDSDDTTNVMLPIGLTLRFVSLERFAFKAFSSRVDEGSISFDQLELVNRVLAVADVQHQRVHDLFFVVFQFSFFHR